MSPSDAADRLRRALAWGAAESPGAPTPQCLGDEVVAAVAEGRLGSDARAAALVHLAECARCRRAVASVGRALADGRVASEIAALSDARRRWRQVAVIVGPMLAASVVLLVLRPGPPAATDRAHRAPTITAVPAPLPRGPAGSVAAADSVRWTSVPGADRYRVMLFDTAGNVVYEIELDDTVAVLPDSVRPGPGSTYLWRVDARTGFDRWSSSPLTEFSVRGPP